MSDAIDGEYIPNDGDHREEVDDDVNSERLLDFTQRVRKELVSEITDGGIPSDKEERTMLLQALRDMDQTSVNRLRLDVDKESNESSRAAQEIVKRLYEINPYGLRVRPGNEVERVPEPNVEDLPEIEFDEGEKAIGLVTETSAEFLQRMEEK